MGQSTSSVTPGYTVDSKITSLFLFNPFAMSSAADVIYVRSGLLSGVIGVGTTMMITPLSFVACTIFVDTCNLLFFTTFMSLSSMSKSFKWHSPTLIRPMIALFVSTPITLNPFSAKLIAVGSPTYPRPTTQIFGFIIITT